LFDHRLCVALRLWNGSGEVLGAAITESPVERWRRAAFYVDKLLKGANAAELPVEQPSTFELVINLKVAKSLGLTIPQLVLLQANQVIQ
jgi:ABC-type uncharacterized transport system substrate-binding protein